MFELLTLAVMAISAVLVWPIRRVRVLNAMGALGIPLIVAYCAYWAPVWLNPHEQGMSAEYSAWSGLIVFLYLPALLVSLIIVAVAERRAKRSNAASQTAPEQPRC